MLCFVYICQHLLARDGETGSFVVPLKWIINYVVAFYNHSVALQVSVNKTLGDMSASASMVHFAVAQGPWSQCTSSLHKLFQSFPSSIGKCRGRCSGEILGGGGLGGGRVQQDSDSFPLLFDFWRLCTHCQL